MIAVGRESWRHFLVSDWDVSSSLYLSKSVFLKPAVQNSPFCLNFNICFTPWICTCLILSTCFAVMLAGGANLDFIRLTLVLYGQEKNREKGNNSAKSSKDM